VRSAGVLPLEPPSLQMADPKSGIPHDIILLEKPPELYHRFRSLACLKAQYRHWRSTGWEPDVVLVYNMSPIYNQFLRWLRRYPSCPKLVLLLLDSPNLGVPTRPWKQFRRRFKPMYTPDSDMIWRFDAGVGLSKITERYFRPRNVPFLWMPGGCSPSRACPQDRSGFRQRNGSVRLGYFGALADHAGIRPLVDTVLTAKVPATLEICGYGKLSDTLKALADENSRLKFHGLLTPADCLQFGLTCDVLVNPRPATHGNENNFSSKLFEYALTGRSILTSNLSGAEEVLGPQAYYFDPRDFDRSLRENLFALTNTSRMELDRRGEAIRQRVVSEFCWTKQGQRLANFLQQICTGKAAGLEEPAAEAMAA
jgi:glycosyltransferase involved in cell wall biosynthesis